MRDILPAGAKRRPHQRQEAKNAKSPRIHMVSFATGSESRDLFGVLAFLASWRSWLLGVGSDPQNRYVGRRPNLLGAPTRRSSGAMVSSWTGV
jgi:hypothetical protein